MAAGGGEVEETSRSFQNRYGVQIREAVLTLKNTATAADVDHARIANRVLLELDDELAQKAAGSSVAASPLLDVGS